MGWLKVKRIGSILQLETKVLVGLTWSNSRGNPEVGGMGSCCGEEVGGVIVGLEPLDLNRK